MSLFVFVKLCIYQRVVYPVTSVLGHAQRQPASRDVHHRTQP